jgi:hypothetical protein
MLQFSFLLSSNISCGVHVTVDLSNVLAHCVQCFAGTQNVSSLQKDEAWKVNVRIHGCDLEQGYLCGTMEALNVPLADTPVRNLFLLPL